MYYKHGVQVSSDFVAVVLLEAQKDSAIAMSNPKPSMNGWEGKTPHAVVLPFSAQGHIIPAMVLAQRLAELGVEVTFVSPEHRIKKLKEAEARGHHEKIKLVGLKSEAPPSEQQQQGNGPVAGHDSMNSIWWTIEHSDEMEDSFVELMKELMKDPKAAPDCIISDDFLSWSQDVANKFGIPRCSFFPSPARALAVIFHVRTLHLEGKLPVETSHGHDESEVELIRVPGLPPFHPDDLMTPILDTSAKFKHEFYVRNSLRIHEASAVAINSFEVLEPLSIKALNTRELNPNGVSIFPVGPLLSEEYFRDDILQQNLSNSQGKECVQWLNQQPPRSVLYISFGSIAMASVDQIREIASGLEASGHGFLWVLRSESLEPASDFLPEGFLDRTSKVGRVLIDTWAPQLQILAHPSTGGFLTHCGWNSVLESICLGMPMLAMPFFAEQKMNAKMVSDSLRVAIELHRTAERQLVEKQEIEKAIRTLMASEEGEEIRRRAHELKKRAKEAVELSRGNLKKFMA